MACTMRSKVLRDETCIKSLGRLADKRAVREGLKICLERARIMTEVFKASEGEPMCIRRAKGLAAVLDNMTLFTRERSSLQAALQARKRHARPIRSSTGGGLKRLLQQSPTMPPC